MSLRHRLELAAGGECTVPTLPGQADLAWYGYPAHQPPASGTALASGGLPGSLPFSPPRSFWRGADRSYLAAAGKRCRIRVWYQVTCRSSVPSTSVPATARSQLGSEPFSVAQGHSSLRFAAG